MFFWGGGGRGAVRHWSRCWALANGPLGCGKRDESDGSVGGSRWVKEADRGGPEGRDDAFGALLTLISARKGLRVPPVPKPGWGAVGGLLC